MLINKAPLALAAAALTVGLSAPASAQIYTWRDTNGNLVLSSHRPAASNVTTYAVPESVSVRATRAVSTSRSRQYDDLIRDHARENGLRADLVRAVVQVESAFNAYAKSAKGAMGLMQLMPATMKQFGVTNPFNPAENIRAGTAYLRQLLDRYQNNETLALAAYNAGPGAVDSHGQAVPPYRETKDYVSRVNQMAGRPVQMRGKQIYKVTEVVDGRPVSRYTDQKPATGEFTVVNR